MGRFQKVTRKILGWYTDKKGRRRPITRKGSYRSLGHYRYKGKDQPFFAPKLCQVKIEQRRQLVQHLKRRGDVLELFAGEGYLTEEVYSKNGWCFSHGHDILNIAVSGSKHRIVSQPLNLKVMTG